MDVGGWPWVGPGAEEPETRMSRRSTRTTEEEELVAAEQEAGTNSSSKSDFTGCSNNNVNKNRDQKRTIRFRSWPDSESGQ